MKFPIFILIMVFVLLFSPVLSFSLEKSAKGDLLSGRLVSGHIDMSNGGLSYQTFKFKVSSDVFAVKITVSNSPADLDVFIKKGSEIENYDNVDYSSTQDAYNESLLISRLSELPLEDGTYYLDVSYQRDTLPVINGKRSADISYNIELDLQKYKVKDTIHPGVSAEYELSPRDGMAGLFALKIPERTNSFRIDLYNTNADLDLMVAYNNKKITKNNNDFLRDSLLGRETLCVNGIDGGQVKPGIYYILVFDQISNDHPVDFSILSSFGNETPKELAEIPRFPTASDEMQNALMSTVEIIGNAAKGSGTLVSSSGYVITNWHVIEDFTLAVSDNIYVAVNLSNELPPLELFKADLIDYSVEKDLALLHISSGLYDNPIPINYNFPYFTLGNTSILKLGQPLTYLGYPKIGGTGSRASISLTRGIVSGFEKLNGSLFIKTDAEINSGNSGGAAINSFYELVAFPTSTIEENAGQLGYLIPVSMIPEEWYRFIGR